MEQERRLLYAHCSPSCVEPRVRAAPKMALYDTVDRGSNHPKLLSNQCAITSAGERGSEGPAGRERGTRARELQTSGGSALGTFWACPPVHSAADDQGGCRALWEREWVRGGVEARQRGAKQLEERMSGLSAPAGAGAAVPSCAEVEQDCAKSGWVYKQSKHVKKWNKRYFVLWPKEAHPKKGRLLFYYTTPQVQIHTPNAVEPRTRPTSSRIRLSAAHAQPRARRTRSLGGWFH